MKFTARVHYVPRHFRGQFVRRRVYRRWYGILHRDFIHLNFFDDELHMLSRMTRKRSPATE